VRKLGANKLSAQIFAISPFLGSKALPGLYTEISPWGANLGYEKERGAEAQYEGFLYLCPLMEITLLRN
jgi:hypothetical protein